MKAKWLLESDVFEEGLDEIQEEIVNQGMEVKIIDYIPFLKKEKYEEYSNEDCVIFHGSLNLAKRLKKKAEWIPGIYYNINNYKCSTYYNYFGEYHINRDYLMLPFGDLERRKKFLFETLGVHNTIFIRPDSGSKQFTGQTVTIETWEKDIKLLGFYDVPDNEIVVVSSPKNIIDEYRFVVIGDEIITGSHYNHKGTHKEKIIEMSSESEELLYAKMVLNNVKWRPDNVFVLDICKTKSKYNVLEIGCFSCAGLYKSDKKIIVDRVSKIALKEWNEYR